MHAKGTPAANLDMEGTPEMYDKVELGILSILTAGVELSADTWAQLIEKRAEMIMPILDRMTLWSIGTLLLPGPDSSEETSSHHEIASDPPATGAHYLSVQGMFYQASRQDMQPTPEHPVLLAAGLSREGRWLIIRVECEYAGLKRRVSGWAGGKPTHEDIPNYDAISVEVEQSSPREIVEKQILDYDFLFTSLASAIHAWRQRIERSRQQAERLGRLFELEDDLIARLKG